MLVLRLLLTIEQRAEADPRLSSSPSSVQWKRKLMRAPFGWSLSIEGEMLREKVVRPLLTEAEELTRIMARSRISASRNLRLSKTTKSK